MFKFKSEKETPEKEFSANAVAIGDKARACLATEQFKSYRDQYESSEQKMIQSMIKTTDLFLSAEFSLEIYGSKMLVYMTRIKDLKMLLDVVVVNSKKGKDSGK